jgi:hypothetical protein
MPVIQYIGPYNINEIYLFAIEKWGADQRLIDLGLMRTKEAEETILPRTDIDDQRKRELVVKMRNGELGTQSFDCENRWLTFLAGTCEKVNSPLKQGTNVPQVISVA